MTGYKVIKWIRERCVTVIKLLACFKKPEDPIDFMNQFEENYLPRVVKIPGLNKTVVNKVKSDSVGTQDSIFFLIHEMHFLDKDAFRRAMLSEENQYAGRELMIFAEGMVTHMVAETDEFSAL